MPLLIANTVLTVAIAIFAETYITFLGLGDPALISWEQKLIENAFKGDRPQRRVVGDHPARRLRHARVILACTMIGMAMEDALNPRLRVGHLSVRRFRLGRSRERWSQE